MFSNGGDVGHLTGSMITDRQSLKPYSSLSGSILFDDCFVNILILLFCIPVFPVVDFLKILDFCPKGGGGALKIGRYRRHLC